MKKAIITGGTSGIGKALAALLQQKGIEVVPFGSKDADLRYTVKPIIDAIALHKPDLVINCAGVGRYGNTLDIPLEEQKEILQINGMAAMEITIEAARFFKENNIKGTILNISSLSGELPAPAMAAYGASKAFLTKFSEALDFELRPLGIRVLVSCPGMVRTNFMHRSAKKTLTHKPKGPTMEVSYAARCILTQLERKIGHYVIDWRYRLAYKLFPLIPNRFLKRTIYNNIQSRL